MSRVPVGQAGILSRQCDILMTILWNDDSCVIDFVLITKKITKNFHPIVSFNAKHLKPNGPKSDLRFAHIA